MRDYGTERTGTTTVVSPKRPLSLAAVRHSNHMEWVLCFPFRM